jgi:hypothetical protein
MNKAYKSRKRVAQEAAEHAWAWVSHKYNIQAAMPDYYLSVQGRFPKYIHRRRRVRIAVKRSKWATYVKKTIGVYANWIPCTAYEAWVLQFVHEFTHVVQGDQKRRYSEVETTRNEIEFAQESFPHLYRRLTTILDD